MLEKQNLEVKTCWLTLNRRDLQPWQIFVSVPECSALSV
jgi:hypothetical protein